MISLLSKPNARCVRTRCSGAPKPKLNITDVFPLLNGEVAKKRNATIKDNLNKFIAIGSNDLKECYDLVVELDQAHKEAFKMKKDNMPSENNQVSEDDNIFVDN
jgi:hypothetical protein